MQSRHANTQRAVEQPGLGSASGGASRLDEASIAALPAPVRRYLHACGAVGQPRAHAFSMVWKRLFLRRAPDARWLSLSCTQRSTLDVPVRVAHMAGKIAGIVPITCDETYRAGLGRMHVRMFGRITMRDVHGVQLDASELVTYLSECLLAPSGALVPGLRWTEVDARCARVSLTHAGCTVSGMFHFDDDGRLVRFSTNDRFQDGKPPRSVPWSATFAAPRRFGALWLPTALSATWHAPEGEFVYARGIVDDITFEIAG